jgi:hypothetical protein
MINVNIDAIIQREEERTVKLNSKYEGLNLDDLNNVKSDATVQQWEGEGFRSEVSLSMHIPKRIYLPAVQLLGKEDFEFQLIVVVEP